MFQFGESVSRDITTSKNGQWNCLRLGPTTWKQDKFVCQVPFDLDHTLHTPRFHFKENKIFLTTLAFLFCFHLSTLVYFIRISILFGMFLSIVHTKTPGENADRIDSIWRFFRPVIVFKTLCFHLSTLKTERSFWNGFRKFPFSSAFAAF